MHAKSTQRPLFVPTETMAVAVRTPDPLLVGFLHAPSTALRIQVLPLERIIKQAGGQPAEGRGPDPAP